VLALELALERRRTIALARAFGSVTTAVRLMFVVMT
jgi:hypothetical protein